MPVEHKLAVVVGLGVLATALLSTKPSLHALARWLSREDLLATLRFLVIAAVVLPLLPNVNYGPLSALNPFQIGLMVVLIAGISFVGYVAMRLLGPERGMGLTGLLGGLVSSTAIAMAMSPRSRSEPQLRESFLLAIVLSSAIMYVRVVLEVAIVNPALVSQVAVPMGAMTFVGLIWGLVLWRLARRERSDDVELPLKNPFLMRSALGFGIIFAAAMLASKAAAAYAGDAGLYITGFVAGTTNVHAITLSMADLAHKQVLPLIATTTIFVGVLSNNIVKAGIALSFGGWRFGRHVAAALLVQTIAGAAALALLSAN